VALCQEAEEILTQSLAVFRERGDAGDEAEALRLLDVIEGATGPYRSSARDRKHAEADPAPDSAGTPSPNCAGLSHGPAMPFIL
jgi:hypothetical protein